MLLLALVISGLSAPLVPPAGQERAYSAVSAETYAPPVVRPYEPPSDFGRQIAEGDADATVRTRPITAPVVVEAYRDTYETRRSRRETSYEQGVEAARVGQNARMGPLDGVWRVSDAQGRVVLDLVLSDRGLSRPVEGALRFARTDRTAVIEGVTTEGDIRTVTATIQGRPLALRLRRQGGGWSGDLTGAGADQAVSLVRQP